MHPYFPKNATHLFSNFQALLFSGYKMVKVALKNAELLQRFKEVETLPEREQSILMEIIGAYIRDFKTKQAYV